MSDEERGQAMVRERAAQVQTAREQRPFSINGAWRKKYLCPEELLAVVEASTVEQLPQQLDCRRRTERFQRGHVDVVDEERHAPVEWWAQ